MSSNLHSSRTGSEFEPLSSSTHAPKDLSFLLDPSIYHPLSNIDVPPAHRYPIPPTPQPNTPVRQLLAEIDTLLKQCRFLPAAHMAATVLASGLVHPTDSVSIFHLLSIRYSALELSGNSLLAAQESKALEDLSSSFYYDDVSQPHDSSGSAREHGSAAKHIMPFDLRLQALRLQGIGFGDTRRAVGALFDLGLECRDHIANEEPPERSLWEARLEEVGVRVVNALIALGDLDCARRTLESMRPREASTTSAWMTRQILLLIKMGEIDEARRLLEDATTAPADQAVLQSLIAIADGDFDEAVKVLDPSEVEKSDPAAHAIARQSLAVAYLYTGRIEKAREIMEALVKEGFSFQALTINLATLYDLTSEKSRSFKEGLANKIANDKSGQPRRGFVNADFKL